MGGEEVKPTQDEADLADDMTQADLDAAHAFASAEKITIAAATLDRLTKLLHQAADLIERAEGANEAGSGMLHNDWVVDRDAFLGRVRNG